MGGTTNGSWGRLRDEEFDNALEMMPRVFAVGNMVEALGGDVLDRALRQTLAWYLKGKYEMGILGIESKLRPSDNKGRVYIKKGYLGSA